MGKNLPVEPSDGVPSGALFDGLHDDLGNRDDNGDDGAHVDVHVDAAHVDAPHGDAPHAPHEILLGFSYLSPLFNESWYIMLD